MGIFPKLFPEFIYVKRIFYRLLELLGNRFHTAKSILSKSNCRTFHLRAFVFEGRNAFQLKHQKQNTCTLSIEALIVTVNTNDFGQIEAIVKSAKISSDTIAFYFQASINASYMIAFSYPILLVIICTVYAVLTRKIPEAFNESKFIGFSMYTTCIIWLAFIPIYFTTSQHVALRITSMSVTISLSATVTIACLFIPKLYIILLHPEKNVRQSMMNHSKYQKSTHQSVIKSNGPTNSNGGLPTTQICNGKYSTIQAIIFVNILCVVQCLAVPSHNPFE